MKIVIFGLSISSSWGNGHATLWRGLCRELIARGHAITFYEKETPYYAANRDFISLPGGTLRFYGNWAQLAPELDCELAAADVAIVTSYCPDAIAATERLRWASPLRVFYDLDTPVTLSRLESGESVPYIGPRGLQDFDLVLSYTGGEALRRLETELGARRVAPLYGSVDPAIHHPTAPVPPYQADLSYLGTYSPDRQEALRELFLEPAAARPDRRFVIGGAQYPDDFSWRPNIFFVRHLPPSEHARFFSSSLLTLNVTRAPMARLGYCPSGRLFEAAACGAALISDSWPGLSDFFEPGREILLAENRDEVEQALALPESKLREIAQAGRRRVLAQHTAAHRATTLEGLLRAASPQMSKGIAA